MQPNPLQTDRLILRAPVMADAPALCAQFSDFEIAKMTASVAHPYPLHAAEMWLMCCPSARRRGLRHSFAVEHADHMIGVASLFRAGTDADWNLGYHIARESWGQGLATEAATAVMRFGFETLNAARIDAGIYTDNPASHRVIKKLGFTRGAPDRVWCMARCQYVDGHSYSCERDNWPNAIQTPMDAT